MGIKLVWGQREPLFRFGPSIAAAQKKVVDMAAKTTFRYKKETSILGNPAISAIGLSSEEISLLFRFYVLEPPTNRQSARGVSLSGRGWEGGFEKSGLKAKLNSVCNLSNVTCEVSNVTGQSKLEDLFEEKGLLEFPIENLAEERGVIVGGSESNAFLRLLRHIRNCLAHGNFVVLKNTDDEAVFIMEDRETTRNPNVTARMVLKKNTLVAWAEAIMLGPETKTGVDNND